MEGSNRERQLAVAVDGIGIVAIVERIVVRANGQKDVTFAGVIIQI